MVQEEINSYSMLKLYLNPNSNLSVMY